MKDKKLQAKLESLTEHPEAGNAARNILALLGAQPQSRMNRRHLLYRLFMSAAILSCVFHRDAVGILLLGLAWIMWETS